MQCLYESSNHNLIINENQGRIIFRFDAEYGEDIELSNIESAGFIDAIRACCKHISTPGPLYVETKIHNNFSHGDFYESLLSIFKTFVYCSDFFDKKIALDLMQIAIDELKKD